MAEQKDPFTVTEITKKDPFTITEVKTVSKQSETTDNNAVTEVKKFEDWFDEDNEDTDELKMAINQLEIDIGLDISIKRAAKLESKYKNLAENNEKRNERQVQIIEEMDFNERQITLVKLENELKVIRQNFSNLKLVLTKSAKEQSPSMIKIHKEVKQVEQEIYDIIFQIKAIKELGQTTHSDIQKLQLEKELDYQEDKSYGFKLALSELPQIEDSTAVKAQRIAKETSKVVYDILYQIGDLMEGKAITPVRQYVFMAT